MGPFDDVGRINADPLGFAQALIKRSTNNALDFDKKSLAPSFGFTPLVELPDFKPTADAIPDIAPFELPAMFGDNALLTAVTGQPAMTTLTPGNNQSTNLLAALGLSSPSQGQSVAASPVGMPSIASLLSGRQAIAQPQPYAIFSTQPIISGLPRLMNLQANQSSPFMPALYSYPFGGLSSGNQQAMSFLPMSSPYAGYIEPSSFYSQIFSGGVQQPFLPTAQAATGQPSNYLSFLAGLQMGTSASPLTSPVALGASVGSDLLALLTGTSSATPTTPADPAAPTTPETTPPATAIPAPGETNINSFLQSLLTAPAPAAPAANPAAPATPDPAATVATTPPAAPAPVVTPSPDPAKPRVRLDGDKIVTGLSFLDNQPSDSKTVSINANDLLNFTQRAAGKPFDITAELTKAKLTPEQIKAASDELAGQTLSFSGKQVKKDDDDDD